MADRFPVVSAHITTLVPIAFTACLFAAPAAAQSRWKKRRVVFGLTPFNAEAQVVEFQTAGFADAFAELQRTCH
ncbi:MAG TPA: hypothetical protein VG871_23310 [Vicinamibacterales bacterium]|nr:hypothetical protein [Vicinamibacterales bacterium]